VRTLQKLEHWGWSGGRHLLAAQLIGDELERPADRREPMFYAQATEDFRDKFMNGLRPQHRAMASIWVHPKVVADGVVYTQNGALQSANRTSSGAAHPTTACCVWRASRAGRLKAAIEAGTVTDKRSGKKFRVVSVAGQSQTRRLYRVAARSWSARTRHFITGGVRQSSRGTDVCTN
jgi:hypothetical protein